MLSGMAVSEGSEINYTLIPDAASPADPSTEVQVQTHLYGH